MNKDEALEYLKELKGVWPRDWSLAQLDKAIAALSAPCPICGGREPKANMVVRVPNPEAPARVESSLNILWGAWPSIEPGELVRVLILPAEEEP